jgi:hypothetical protein
MSMDVTDVPVDSIDGLGMTFEHLSSKGQRLAVFRSYERMRKGQLTDEQRVAIAEALKQAKGMDDKMQADLRKLIAPE